MDGEILWTEEARRRVENAPAFVRPGIWKLMERRARERGRTMITSEFLTEIRHESMLRVAQIMKRFGFEELTIDAFEEARRRMRNNPRKAEVMEQIKAYLAQRTSKNLAIIEKFERYLQTVPAKGLPWTEEAMGAMARVPTFVRELARQTIEERAKERGARVVTPESVRAIVADLAQGSTGQPRGMVTLHAQPDGRGQAENALTTLPWSEEARERLQRIPIPFVRWRIAQRVEAYARAQGLCEISLQVYEAGKGSSLSQCITPEGGTEGAGGAPGVPGEGL